MLGLGMPCVSVYLCTCVYAHVVVLERYQKLMLQFKVLRRTHNSWGLVPFVSSALLSEPCGLKEGANEDVCANFPA